MTLQLLAQSVDDVPALSALIQDAAVRRSDIHYDAKARRLVLLMARYCWEMPAPTRRRAALRFDYVMQVQHQGMDTLPKEAVLELLGVTAEPAQVQLIFAGTAALRMQVETLDITLDDFGDAWPAIRQPRHSTLKSRGGL
jgi:hypothetical protein